ncbi:MAG: hypothetical protein IIA34_02050 [Proteobacteria bacterium]|nr:hypothetical protein [Pseudomonadota bacterium]
MTDEELAALALWLRRTQEIDLDPADLRAPAATAGKFGALAGRAAAELAFGAEPSGFGLATGDLKRGDLKPGNLKRTGGGDAR